MRPQAQNGIVQPAASVTQVCGSRCTALFPSSTTQAQEEKEGEEQEAKCEHLSCQLKVARDIVLTNVIDSARKHDDRKAP